MYLIADICQAVITVGGGVGQGQGEHCTSNSVIYFTELCFCKTTSYKWGNALYMGLVNVFPLFVPETE
jgi:hypothetical protein